MSHSHIAYIDESGCDGIKKFRSPGAQGGASHWLTMGGLIVESSQDPNMPRWRDSIISSLPNHRKRTLHFSKLKHEQKIVACRAIANMPVRCIAIMSNKTTIPNYPRPDLFQPTNSLYWYLCRYLIERISQYCFHARSNSADTVKLIFSRRGGMDYQDFRDYLLTLNTKELTDGTPSYIKWNVLDINAVEAINHTKRAGLQIADGVAYSFQAAVEPSFYGDTESRYAKILKPITHNTNGRYLGIGIKPVPTLREMTLTPDQSEFFDYF